MEAQIEFKTEDGVIVIDGDWVYNYYDMFPVQICLSDYRQSDDGWFNTAKVDGSRVPLLNGERICTLNFAVRKGWNGAAELQAQL